METNQHLPRHMQADIPTLATNKLQVLADEETGPGQG
jgi:hypothetical protein